MFDEQLKERAFIFRKLLIRALYISVAMEYFHQMWLQDVSNQHCVG
jgi:hypothetical protein